MTKIDESEFPKWLQEMELRAVSPYAAKLKYLIPLQLMEIYNKVEEKLGDAKEEERKGLEYKLQTIRGAWNEEY